MFQRAELAAAEQIGLSKVELPLHFAFRLRPPGPTSDGPKTVVRGEGQEASVVDRLIAFVAGDHDFHVVIETGSGRAAQIREGPHVLAERGLHVLGVGETQVLSPAVAQEVTEQIHLAAAFLGEIQGVDAIVHLRLNAWSRLKTLHGWTAELRPQLLHPLPKNRVAARVTHAPQLLQQADHAHLGIPREIFTQRGLVGVHLAATHLRRRGQAGDSLGTLLLVPGDRPRHRLARQVQVPRDPAHRLAAVPAAENLITHVLGHGRWISFTKSSVSSATVCVSPAKRTNDGSKTPRSHNAKSPRP